MSHRVRQLGDRARLPDPTKGETPRNRTAWPRSRGAEGGYDSNGDATEVGGAPLTATDAGRHEKVAASGRAIECREEFGDQGGDLVRPLERREVTEAGQHGEARAREQIGHGLREMGRRHLVFRPDQHQ